MSKTIINTIVIIVCILCLSSCQSSTPGNQTLSGEKTHNNLNDTLLETSYNDINLEMVVPWGGLMNTPIATSSTGCYEIFINNDWSCNILYTDVPSRQRIYLSPDLSADHHSESDTSWIEDAQGGCSVFVAEDKLYVSCYGYETAGVLYQSELSGQNRKKLVEYNEYSPITKGVASDGQFLYTILPNKSQELQIVRIDTINGKIEDCLGLTEDNAFLMSAFDNYLVIKTISSNNDMQSKDAVEAYKNQVHKIYTYSITDSKLTEIISWQQDEIQETYEKEKIYIFDLNKDLLYCMDIRNGIKSDLISPLSGIGIDKDNLETVSYVYDNHILLNLYENRLKAINIDDLNLISIKPLENSDVYPNIIGEYEDSFLVTAGNLEVPKSDTAPDGTPITTNVIMNQLALVSKDNYWKSDYELEPVQNIFLEN